MPTNLTADIYHGETEVTLADYAQRCAFATEVLGRDPLDPADGLPDTFIANYETNDGDARKLLEDAKAQLAEAEEWTDEEAETASSEHFEGLSRYREDYRAAQKQLKERYKTMLTQVTEWEAPDTEEHNALKDLMIQQLKLSMEHDCRDPWGGKATKKLKGPEFKRHHVEIAKERIEKLEAFIVKAEDDAKTKADFVHKLKDNLGITAGATA